MYKLTFHKELHKDNDVILTEEVDSLYCENIEHGENIVDDIIDFVKTIPYAPHYHLTPYAQVYFSRYGQNLQYTFFKRKSSKHTTWYIFFSRQEDLYIIILLTTTKTANTYMPPSRNIEPGWLTVIYLYLCFNAYRYHIEAQSSQSPTAIHWPECAVQPARRHSHQR